MSSKSPLSGLAKPNPARGQKPKKGAVEDDDPETKEDYRVLHEEVEKLNAELARQREESEGAKQMYLYEQQRMIERYEEMFAAFKDSTPRKTEEPGEESAPSEDEVEDAEGAEFGTPFKADMEEQFFAETVLPRQRKRGFEKKRAATEGAPPSRRLTLKTPVAAAAPVSAYGARLRAGEDLISRVLQFSPDEDKPKLHERMLRSYEELKLLKSLSPKEVYTFFQALYNWCVRHNSALPIPLTSFIEPKVTQVLESSIRFVFNESRTVAWEALKDATAVELIRYKIRMQDMNHFRATLRQCSLISVGIDLKELPPVGASFDSYLNELFTFIERFTDVIKVLCNGPTGFEFCPPCNNEAGGLIHTFYSMADPRLEAQTWPQLNSVTAPTHIEEFKTAFCQEVTKLAARYQEARGLEFALKQLPDRTRQRNRELNLVDRPQGLFETDGFPLWSNESFQSYMADERAAAKYDERQRRLKDDYYLGYVAPTTSAPRKKKLFDPHAKSSYPEEYREPMVCRKMMLFNSCPDGSECRYSHVKSELDDARQWYRRKLEARSPAQTDRSQSHRVSVPVSVSHITSRDTSSGDAAKEEEDSESED